ncbi:MAG: hypothetical protein WKF30_01105 [Pyrinomonadaceae bacterium]
MVEERNVATARVAETTVSDDETTKEELQRRMEEARESITQTVAEIKDTVSTQYQTVRESINDALDWREQYQRRPVAFHIGALSVGFFVGYGLAAAAGNDRRKKDYSVFDVSESEDYEDEDDIPQYKSYSPSRDNSAFPVATSAPVRPSMAAASATAFDAPDEPQKPGLIDRFKETRAFDRLQQEVSSLGDRLVDEVSHTAQAVVLPALLGKLKDMIGIDLGAQQKESKRSALERESTEARNEAINAASNT